MATESSIREMPATPPKGSLLRGDDDLAWSLVERIGLPAHIAQPLRASTERNLPPDQRVLYYYNRHGAEDPLVAFIGRLRANPDIRALYAVGGVMRAHYRDPLPSVAITLYDEFCWGLCSQLLEQKGPDLKKKEKHDYVYKKYRLLLEALLWLERRNTFNEQPLWWKITDKARSFLSRGYVDNPAPGYFLLRKAGPYSARISVVEDVPRPATIDDTNIAALYPHAREWGLQRIGREPFVLAQTTLYGDQYPQMQRIDAAQVAIIDGLNSDLLEL